MRSRLFDANRCDKIGDAHELRLGKPRITIRRAFQEGIAVYQLTKLQMLEFYYNLLDKYVDHRDLNLIQMDTEGMYMALATKTIDKAVRPEMTKAYLTHRQILLHWNTCSNRTPGLFKFEFEGSRAIALCNKCYYVDDVTLQKPIASAKGISSNPNDIKHWLRYVSTFQSRIDFAQNKGFRMVDGCMKTYLQEKLGISAYYKRISSAARWQLHRTHILTGESISRQRVSVSTTSPPLRTHFITLVSELR